ncbi:MAG: hypothetical protein AAB252_03120, partial [Pseudomonadota bacterium]
VVREVHADLDGERREHRGDVAPEDDGLAHREQDGAGADAQREDLGPQLACRVARRDRPARASAHRGRVRSRPRCRRLAD